MTEDLGGLPFEQDEASVATTGVDPFSGDSQRFTWPRQANIGQLQIEITEALGDQVRLAFISPRDTEGGDVEVSDEAPLIVFVTPSSADLAAVRQVMAAHRPDPYYGMSDEERQVAQLQEKIRSGADLTMEEMQKALRMLVS
ncbi:hypothetical protein ABZS76_33100 [Streptomyces sp. NPDC005562]|uniref:hypothetical protein n=1 Tax=Streptomyces sp. NPDC005562 TaxID=3154890 RepID=UPI0033B055DB